MTWSVDASDVTSDHVVEDLQQVELPSEQRSHEAGMTLYQAKQATIKIIQSGVLGHGSYHIHLAGHAVPDHRDVEGYSTDMVSVSITRKRQESTDAR